MSAAIPPVPHFTLACIPKGCQTRKTVSMSQVCLYVHFVFATKHRYAWLDESWRPRLYDYIGGIIRGLDAVLLGVGGIEDHVHLLVSLKATHQIADFMREVKRSSTIWIHDTINLPSYAWSRRSNEASLTEKFWLMDPFAFAKKNVVRITAPTLIQFHVSKCKS